MILCLNEQYINYIKPLLLLHCYRKDYKSIFALGFCIYTYFGFLYIVMCLLSFKCTNIFQCLVWYWPFELKILYLEIITCELSMNMSRKYLKWHSCSPNRSIIMCLFRCDHLSRNPCDKLLTKHKSYMYIYSLISPINTFPISSSITLLAAIYTLSLAA